MNTQPTTSTAVFAGYDIKQVSEFGHLTATNKKHIKAIFAAGMWTAKANRINYEITKDGLEFSVRIVSGNNASRVKFILIGYTEQPALEELPMTAKELSVCTWTENADSAMTDGKMVYFYCGGLLMEGLEMSVEEVQISIDAMYEIEAEKAKLQSLEVGQTIQGENCYLVVTSISTPRAESDIDLIYNNTNDDYRSIVDGKKSIIYTDRNGHTVLGAIATMPKKIFNKKLKWAKNAMITPEIEYTWSYNGAWYITTDLVLKGRGIKLSNDGSNHKRGKKTYHITDLAFKAIKEKYTCQYVNK